MLISVHIPKCAGTSFRKILDVIFGKRIWHNYGTIFSKQQARPGIVPTDTSIIHGHFIADSFDDLYPERQLITWVRHPVERLVSNYFHFLRSPDMRDDCCRILHEQELNLREFADLDWMKNLGTRYLANKPPEEFGFVGIAEQFRESMHVFSEQFGLRRFNELPRENTNPNKRDECYSISSEDHDYILDRNRIDLEWYEQAVKRLSSEKKTKLVRTA